jgi:hypothetical protein
MLASTQCLVAMGGREKSKRKKIKMEEKRKYFPHMCLNIEKMGEKKRKLSIFLSFVWFPKGREM